MEYFYLYAALFIATAAAIGFYIRSALFLQEIDSLRQELKIQEQFAYHDALTGLPNRRMLDDYYVRLLSHINRQGGKLAVFVMDLDRFKEVNDRYGHNVGDLVLKEVAARFVKVVKRKHEMVARNGGDEFIILFPDYNSEKLVGIAEKIIAAIDKPFVFEKIAEPIQIGVSIGISFLSKSRQDVIKYADAAMYQAKKLGGNEWHIYAEDNT